MVPNKYGVNAGPAINSYANDRIREWLKKEITVTVIDENGNETEVIVPQLYNIRSRALLEELIAFDPIRNFDRIRALGMLMLYREEKIIENGGNYGERDATRTNGSDLANGDYFTRNYDRR